MRNYFTAPLMPKEALVLSLNRNKSEAEAEVAVSVAGKLVAPATGTTVPGAAVPAASPELAYRAASRPGRIGPNAAVITMPIPAPFPHVSVHVVQAPCIGTLLAYRVGGVAAVFVVPADFV